MLDRVERGLLDLTIRWVDDVRSGRLQEQYYSVYRDLRSWTAAITGGVRDNGSGPKDYSLAFTFSFKAKPKFGVGGDSVRPYSMLGLQE